jgi:hypothetical protein
MPGRVIAADRPGPEGGPVFLVAVVVSAGRMKAHHESYGAKARMLTIRLPKTEWAKAWRAMIEVAPVRLIKDDPIYEVLPVHLEVLTARGLTYEVVPMRPRRAEKRRHGTAD